MACGHKGCLCDDANIEVAGNHFCSEKCADVETSGEKERPCGCGHPDCAAV